MPHRGDDLAGSLSLLRIWDANLGETFGEDSPLATGVPATPATLATGGSPACLGQEGLSETANTGYGVSARWIGNQDRQQSADRELP
jgi:hypothetical protein